MSYFDVYRLEQSVRKFDYSMEGIDITSEDISTESVGDKFKKIIKTVVDFFKGIYYHFKHKVVKWLRSRRQNKEIKTLEQLLKDDYIGKQDITKLAEMYFDRYPLLYKALGLSSNKDKYHVFNQNGGLWNITDVISKTDKKIKELINLVKEDVGFSEGTGDIRSMVYDEAVEDILGKTTEKIKINLTKDELLNAIKTMDSDLIKAESFYNSNLENLNKLLKDIESGKIIDNTHGYSESTYISIKMNTCKAAIKLLSLPQSLILNAIRFVGFLTNTAVGEEYSTTTTAPAKPIYHLSSNGKLSTLTPRIGGSNYGEYLPPRISFAETVESCTIGIPRYFSKPDGKNGNESYKDLYLYEAIQKDGETRYIKPRLVEAAMHGVVQHRLKEVCVATPIDVKLKGKIRIFYHGDKLSYHPGFFIRYEELTE